MSMLDNIGEELKKIPPWGYVLVAAGGFIGWQFLQSQNSSNNAAAQADLGAVSGSTTTPTDSGTSSNGGTATPPSTSSAPSTSTTPPTTTSTGSSGGPKPPVKTSTYTVKSGDTLSSIASMESGKGNATSWEDIYNANQGIIESTARAHNFSSSDDGHWIFPGEVLQIP